ncbi:uncharacterized protein BDZ83DRAFT_654761 [Colletotrichum acutatum]|uniref:Uncharacterized protein n=1 Tax=Glomerella acutata TaxID=27357 RepID=A0AAD8XBF6_GLOAC|nr:uncharacterized protein BDZ83DRAFT_654761 [Colletotrichum acutatum]KAK1719470.1 hypothetical protein BDZ83DRAFT_654761 [Colletotrichum acutatum]
MPPAPAPPSASVLLPLHLRPAPTRKSGGRHVPHVPMNKPLFPNELPTPSGNLTTAPAEARERNLNQVVSRQASAIVGWSCLCSSEFLSLNVGSSPGTTDGDIKSIEAITLAIAGSQDEIGPGCRVHSIEGNVVSWTTWYFIWVANINGVELLIPVSRGNAYTLI